MSDQQGPNIDDAAGVDALWRIIEDDPVFAPYLPGATGCKALTAVQSVIRGGVMGLDKNETHNSFQPVSQLGTEKYSQG